MTEEIAHVSGSTADTPGHVGRVSNVLNQTTTGGRIGPQPETETADPNQGRDKCKANTTHIALYRFVLARMITATKAG